MRQLTDTLTWDTILCRLRDNGIEVSRNTLKRFIQNNAELPPPLPFPNVIPLPSPPSAVRRRIANAIQTARCALQRQAIRTPSVTPPPSPRRLRPRRHSVSPVPQPPPQAVTPRTRRRAEVRNNQAPESPQRRRLPQPLRPPLMQPLQPPLMQPRRPHLAPRTLIARQLLDPTVDVSHNLSPFDVKCVLFFLLC